MPHAGGLQDAPNSKEEGKPVPTIFNYDDTSWPDVEKDHAAVITYLDVKVGDLIGRLKDLPLMLYAVDGQSTTFMSQCACFVGVLHACHCHDVHSTFMSQCAFFCWRFTCMSLFCFAHFEVSQLSHVFFPHFAWVPL